MKNKLLLAFALFFSTVTFAQSNCLYSVTNVTAGFYQFYPNSSYSPNIYHFLWEFGDGTSSVQPTPGHPYNSFGPYLVCCTVYDSSNVIACSTCDTLFVTGGSCYYTSTLIGPGAFTFQGSVRLGAYAHWEFGDFSTANGSTVTHTYIGSGTYNVCMTEIDSATGTTLCQFCNLVTVSGFFTCSYTASQNPANPNVVTFTSSAFPPSSVQWNFGDGLAGSGSSPTHTYASPGSYLVCMDIVDTGNGSVLCSYCDSVVVSNSVSTNCSYTAIVDSVNPYMFYFFTSIAPGSTIYWDFGDNTSPSSTLNPVHTYNSSGLFTVCVHVMDSNGITCTHCDVVNPGPVMNPCVYTYLQDSANANLYYFAASNVPAGAGVYWDFGDGVIGYGSLITHTYSVGGAYAVCMSEYDSSSQALLCQSCFPITVPAGNNGCQPYFTFSNLGLTAYFIDLSNANTSAASYSWDFGDGATSTNRFPQHVYALPGNYNVCLTLAANGCIGQYCANVFVDTSFISNPVCQAYFVFVQVAPFQFSVVNLSSGLNLNFTWDFGDGSPTSNQAYPSHYYTQIGSYNLCLTVDDGNGCVNTYCDTLSVDSLGNIFRILSGFSINVISPAQLNGVNEISAATSFSVYPNPASTSLTVSINQDMRQSVSYEIFTITGSEAGKGIFNKTENVLNISQLNPGAYILELRNAAGYKSHQKIIIK